MGIYTDEGSILGIRILIEEPVNSGAYYVKHEFTGPNWKYDALHTLSFDIQKNGVKIQTLNPFSTSYNIQTDNPQEPGNIWLDNYNIRVEDLY